MSPAPLGVLLAKVTVLLLVALGTSRVLRRAPAGARHLVWLGTLAALLVVPVLGVWGTLRVPVLSVVAWPSAALQTGAPPAADASATWLLEQPTPASPAILPIHAPARGDTPAIAVARVVPLLGGAPRVADGPTPRTGMRPDGTLEGTFGRTARRVMAYDSDATALLVLWAGGALVLGLALARAWFTVWRIVRRAQPLDSIAWRDALYEVADRLGLADAPRLVRSDAVAMPFACGLRRPTVVLPAASDAWTPERRRAVLLHELAHVRRRDLAAHTLARVVCAAYWFHPLVWTAARRLRAESERACDDLALAAGTPAADYAEHLLEIVAAVRRDRTPAVALAMARRREFEGRVLDILDPERPRRPARRRQLAALAGALALVTLVVGAAAPAPETGGAAASNGSAVDRRAREATHTSSAPYQEAPDTRPTAAAHERLATDALPALAIDRAGSGAQMRVGDVVASGDTSAGADAAGGAGAPIGSATGDSRLAWPAIRAMRAWKWIDAPRAAGADDGRAALLVRVLRTDTTAELRRVAAWGLAQYVDDAAAAAALAASVRADRSADVREMAAWALEGAGDVASRDALAGVLRADADPGVRATAAWALGSLGDPAAAPALTAALADASSRVRERATWALGSVGPRRAPPALVAQLAGEPGIRLLTAWALYTIQDSAVTPALERALRDEHDARLQRAYVRALTALGQSSAGALRALFESPDPGLRAAALRGLAGGDAALPWPWPWPDPRPSPSR